MLRRTLLQHGASWSSAALATPLLAACRKQPSQPAPADRTELRPGTKVVFTMWGTPRETETRQHWAEMFNQEYQRAGLSAEYLPQPDQYYDKLQTQMAGGVAPDVFAVNPTWTLRFAPQGLMAELDPLVQRDRYDLGDFHPKAVEQYRHKGSLFVLPRDFGLQMFYY